MEEWQPVGALQHFHALLTAQARGCFRWSDQSNGVFACLI